jgi:hypothetical protein
MTKYTINELANSKGVSQPVREALLQMADYKQLYEQVCEQYDVLAKELEAIKQALAAPVQEPVAWANPNDLKNFDMKVRTNGGPLHTLPLCLCTPPAAPVQEPVFKPCSCRWKGEEQVQQCTLHAAHIEAIHEWAERAKTAEAKLKEKTNEQ